jgi:membrane protein
VVWILASIGLTTYVSNFASVSALYGAFTGAILLIVWLWLSNVALLLGAELDAEIEREKELAEGVPPEDTLDRPPKVG